MGYERNPRIAGSQGEYFGSRDPQDTDRGGYEYRYGDQRSSARDYAAVGEYDRDNDRDRYGNAPRGYGQSQRYGNDRELHDRGYSNRGPQRAYRGSYASDGHRFAETERSRDDGGRAAGYDYEERDFFNRAGDEVRSWFGDAEAERRREMDSRYDERQQRDAHPHDADYHGWRRGQIEALDRDYHEYRQENRAKFDNEFGSWRQERQTQRGSLTQVTEHMDVVGSDGGNVGTVDKVRGDRILLTKSDADAGGRHHSIPSRWIDRVDDKVTLRKTADEAQAHWRDEERNQALFGDTQRHETSGSGSATLNRSFSGTY